jgi:hypothetical protein
MKRWVAAMRDLGLAAQLAVLAGAVLAVWGLVAPVAGLVGGVAGLAAAATAGGVCWLGAAAALVASRAFGDGKRALSGVLYGMLLRMGIPLFSALALQMTVKYLADAHLLVYFLAFYPVTLLLETTLSLPRPDATEHCRDVSQDAAS